MSRSMNHVSTRARSPLSDVGHGSSWLPLHVPRNRAHVSPSPDRVRMMDVVVAGMTKRMITAHLAHNRFLMRRDLRERRMAGLKGLAGGGSSYAAGGCDHGRARQRPTVKALQIVRNLPRVHSDSSVGDRGPCPRRRLASLSGTGARPGGGPPARYHCVPDTAGATGKSVLWEMAKCRHVRATLPASLTSWSRLRRQLVNRVALTSSLGSTLGVS